ncbi:MAG: hypothetical protein ACI8XB_001666 [Patiriisocius sp.]|jgi:hypothetical protein
MNKSFLYLIALSIVLISCSKENQLNDVDPIIVSDNNKMLMLKIDYTTLVFEEGIEFNFNSLGSYDSIPLSVLINEPGDFGDITILHSPTADSIFFGTVIWSGLGERIFPETMSPATSFVSSPLLGPAPLPENFTLNMINSSNSEDLEIIDFESTWGAISNLESVANYVQNEVHLALLKYTPGVGIGDPEEWDWYLMIYQ